MADLDLEEILKETLEVVTRSLDADAASFFLHAPETDEIVLFASYRGESRIDLLHIPFKAQSIVGRVLLENCPHLSPDTSIDPYHNKETEKATGYRIRNLIAVPFDLRLRPDRVDHLVLEVMNRNNHFRLDGNSRDLIAFRLGGNILEGENRRLADDLIQAINARIENRSDARLDESDIDPLLAAYSGSERETARRIVEAAAEILRLRPDRTFAEPDLKLCRRLMKIMMGQLQGAVSERDRSVRAERLESMLQSLLAVEESGAESEKKRLNRIALESSQAKWLWVWDREADETRIVNEGAEGLPEGIEKSLMQRSRVVSRQDQLSEEMESEGYFIMLAAAGGNAAALVGDRRFDFDARLALQTVLAAMQPPMSAPATGDDEYRIFDRMGLAALLLDREKRVSRANEAFERLSGRRTPEMLGREWAGVLPSLKRLGIAPQLNHLAHSAADREILYDAHGYTVAGGPAVYLLGQSRLDGDDSRRMIWAVDVSTEYWKIAVPDVHAGAPVFVS